jgi:hypothetical protein
MNKYRRQIKKHKPGKFKRVRQSGICRKCGSEVPKLDENNEECKLNAKGMCPICNHINIWFAKRGFAPGEGSTKRLNRKDN